MLIIINLIVKKSKVKTQESEVVEKETLNVNIQTSHIEQYVSNEHIMERVPHQKRSEKELSQNKDARERGIGKRKAGKDLRENEKEEIKEINKEICPCCKMYVEAGVECGQCGSWFHYKFEGTTEKQVKNNYPEHIQYVCKKDQLTNFAHAENINNPNQDNIVVGLKEKL